MEEGAGDAVPYPTVPRLPPSTESDPASGVSGAEGAGPAFIIWEKIEFDPCSHYTPG